MMDPINGITTNGDDHVGMHLIILPNRLRIGKIRSDKIPELALPLIKLILFPPATHSRFTSLTRTSTELSVVLDEEDIALFPNGSLQLCDKSYRALQISEGSLGFVSFGIVQALTVPLASAGISIFYLSTYETDFTLIPESNLNQAIEVLKGQFAIAMDTDSIGDLPPQTICSPNPNFERHPLFVPDGDLFMGSIKKDQIQHLGTNLIDLFFVTGSTQPFFSYTQTPEEISVILSKDSTLLFPEETLNVHTECWKLIKVDEEDLGFDEAGVVASIADPLAKAHISLFYISTYATDFTLVLSNDSNRALKALLDSKFEIRTAHS